MHEKFGPATSPLKWAPLTGAIAVAAHRHGQRRRQQIWEVSAARRLVRALNDTLGMDAAAEHAIHAANLRFMNVERQVRDESVLH